MLFENLIETVIYKLQSYHRGKFWELSKGASLGLHVLFWVMLSA